MKRFSFQEKRVIDALYNADRPLTTAEVAQEAEASWITAKKYLKILKKKKYVEMHKLGGSIYWMLSEKESKIQGKTKELKG